MQKIVSRVAFLVILIALFIPETGYGQSSLVPSYHPVYEWLYIQRVKGNLPYYDYESLPLSRKDILAHLNNLNRSKGYQTGKEAQTLKSFLREFNPEHLKDNSPHSLFTYDSRLSFDRFKKWAWSDNEKHIFSYADSSGFLVLDHGFGRKSFFVSDNGVSRTAPYIIDQHWRTYGDFKNMLGYHVEQIRAVPVGDQLIFEYDGFYSYNWKALNKIPHNNYHYEAYVTAAHSIFELSIGRGNLKEGVGQTENLYFSRSSIATDWVKFKVGKKRISYKIIHGKVSWRPTERTLESDTTVNTLNSPQRWYVYHKASIKPFPWITISATEMVNYSNRGLEIAYLNPVNRYFYAEKSLQNQDNGWFGGAIIAQPLRNVELYTQILLDDLGNKRDILFKKKFPATSRFARRYGANIATNSGLLFWGEYTRIDPFTYSHPEDLNAHTDKGIGLGSQIGPNADRLESGIKLWGAGRTFLSLSYSYNRQGLDEFDENGNRIFLAGASPNDGRERDIQIEQSYLFLDGDLHEWHRFLVQGSFEPKRGYIFELNFDLRKMIKGDQLDDLAIFWADFTFGF